MKRPFIVFICALIFVSTAFVPAPAEAQLLVHDPINLVPAATSAVTAAKQFLNPIFYQIAQRMIQSMQQSTVNWINSGFKGSPAYATDIQGTLQDAADQAANQFVQQFRSSLHISSPFRDFVGQNVLNNYYLSTSRDGFFLQNPYTLNGVTKDDRAFLNGDFSKGGFSAWLSSNLNCSNNPICALNAANTELANRIAGVQGQLHEELGWGNGFLSWRKCDVQGPSVQDNTQQDIIPVLDANGKQVGTTVGATTVTSLTQQQTCLSSHIETPGSVIANQINHSLGLGADSLVNAKEFDEIVNALVAQLMNNVLSSTGLAGISRGSTASGGRSYFDQAVANNTSAGVAVASAFLQTLSTETSQLQTYQSNWQQISNAANTAKGKLQAQTGCDFSTQITTIDSVITQAATNTGHAATLISALNSLQSKVTQASAGTDSGQQNSTFQAASDSYTCLLQGGTLNSDGLTCTPLAAGATNTAPGQSDFTDAQAQVDTNADSSLLSQMNHLGTTVCSH